MITIMPSIIVLALAGGPTLALDDGGDPPPVLTLPDEPMLPPFRQDRPAPAEQPPRVMPQDSGKTAETVPPQTPAEVRKARIDDLFRRLAAATDEREAAALSAMIDRAWLQSGSDTADLLMARAIKAVDGSDYKLAESLLDKVVILQPGWAEAWNKRATVHYLDDDDAASMEDISHVLALEPRHYGALSGMGFILHRNGDDKDALTVLRRALAIDPQNSSVKAMVKELSPEVDGRDL